MPLKEFSQREAEYFQRSIGLPPRATFDELVKKIKHHRYHYEETKEPPSQNRSHGREGILVITDKGMYLYHKEKRAHDTYVIDDSVENMVNTYAEYSKNQFQPVPHSSD